MRRASFVRQKKTERGRAAVVITIILLAAILVAGLTVYFLMKTAGPADFLTAAARMAPESTQVFIAIDGTKLDFAESMKQEALSALEQSASFQEAKNKLHDTLGLQLDDDVLALIRPSAALALAPLDGKKSIVSDVSAAQLGAPPFRLCLLLVLEDEQKAGEVMESIQTQIKTPYKEETYAGVALHAPEASGKGPAWAVNQGMLIVGSSVADLKTALDGAAKKGRSLADSPQYLRAVSTLKRKDAMVAYADLQGIVQSERLQNIEQKEVRELMGALRTAVAGSAIEGEDLVSEFKVKIDPGTAGTLGADILKPDYGLEIKSVDIMPADTEMFFAVNAKMLWQMTYDIMGRFMQGRMLREFPAAQLQQKGIDLQRDILDAFTGELALSMPDYSKVAALQFGSLGEQKDPKASMAEIQRMPMLIVMPFAQKSRFDALLEKPFLKPLLQVFIVEEHKGVKIHNMVGQFAYATHDDALIMGVNKGDEGIRGIIDAQAEKRVLKTRPGFSKIGDLLEGSRPVFVSFMDMEKAYGAVALQIESKDPGMARLFRTLSKMGCGWQAWTIRADGLYGVSIQTEMKL
jgi:hypothetical protein